MRQNVILKHDDMNDINAKTAKFIYPATKPNILTLS